ncbi:MAG TPA: DUF4345 domain-containing protein [Sphingobium sp.]
MTPHIEKRLLQTVVSIACVVPLLAGTMGIVLGAAWYKGVETPPVDLNSHFRYLSGLLLAIGISFLRCVPDIEIKTERFRLLCFLVIVGGLARLVSMVIEGLPSQGQIFGLGMELIVVPLLMLWQGRLDRRFQIIVHPPRETPHPLLGKKKVSP